MALSDLKFVTTGAWGAGLDRILTAIEHDTNVYTLREAIQYLIDNPPDGISVVDATVVGRQLTFIMSDASTIGPIELPVATLNPVGDWTAATQYYAMDIVTDPATGSYLVILDHVSDTTFDPAFSTVDGACYYLLGAAGGGGGGSFATFPFTDSALTLDNASVGTYREYQGTGPTEITVTGDAGFAAGDEVIFRQASDASSVINLIEGSGTQIRRPNGYSLGTFGAYQTFKLRYAEAGFYHVWDFIPLGMPAREFITTFSGSGLTPLESDAGGWFALTNAGGCDVLLPNVFPDGGMLTFRQNGAGPITLHADTTATVVIKPTLNPATLNEGDIVFCKWRAVTSEWYLWGDLAPAS